MSLASPKQSILNPVIPYTGTILGGLEPGEMVLIQGTVLSDADRFQVDFMCGSSTKPRADIAFHFNPRFKRSPCIVCNSLQGDRWGREEILYEMPFKQGAPFEAIILIQEKEFKVAVNGMHTVEFRHRVDLARVNTLGMYGKVKVDVVAFFLSSELFSESFDFTLPYKGSLFNGMRPGQTIMIKGQINAYPHSFTVNLGSSTSSDIALHLNPRIKAGVFIRNSFLHECWGPEENTLPKFPSNTLPKFPFTPGEYFEMIILCEAHQFKVAVNGIHLLDFRHRVQDLSRIQQVEILGDLQLLDMKVW
ncbi:galectin-8 isoform X2 [Amia ocellicauda]|uniref:galectin-8 isoform X2 n=1 Tax=Amia ocellicauda TaxID=2972642 RepID=UPI003463AD15